MDHKLVYTHPGGPLRLGESLQSETGRGVRPGTWRETLDLHLVEGPGQWQECGTSKERLLSVIIYSNSTFITEVVCPERKVRTFLRRKYRRLSGL